ncbi:S46 family peptidase [Rurimicrobium arvi]
MFLARKSRLLRFSITAFAAFSISSSAIARKGMPVPATLSKIQKEMIAEGLDIPVSKLYNTRGTGLNNAVVLFGKGCTGEVISSEGLLLTNHHCGYGTVQGLASVGADYFADGFWAKNRNEEIPCPGLTVTFIRSMEDVTSRVLANIPLEMNEKARDSMIQIRIKALENGYRYTSKKDAQIRSFANGNQYWVMITDTYKDIRLVGFPPNGIGQFGGDTDNWSWPRHTGDFSMFRIYAGADNKPAAYSAENKPYHTADFFTINTNGYKEGDFTMVYGFPAQTQEYVSSMQLAQVVNIVDPIRIEARTRRLDIWTKHMSADRKVFLQYTSKRAGVANGWKKWQGEVRGLKLNNVVALKQREENIFQSWANTDSSAAFARDLLARMQVISASSDAALAASEHMREDVLGIELIAQGAELDRVLKLIQSMTGTSAARLNDTLAFISAASEGFYKNYDAATDKEVFAALMPLFMEKASAYVPEYFRTELARFGGSYEMWADYVFGSSAASDPVKMKGLLASGNIRAITEDPAWKLYAAIMHLKNEKVAAKLNAYNDSMVRFNRLYMKAQMMQHPELNLMPDANFTLRLAFGHVKGLDPDGDAGYSFQTDLDGAVAKNNPEVAEFKMPARLLELYREKDYGKYAVNGTVPLAFIADNHTSGGNSGSPVLNARGELIGTNFDRVWEGTMSDYYFDPRWCRNITLDIRYTLFIIDKFGGAGWLLNEMKFAPAPSR